MYLCVPQVTGFNVAVGFHLVLLSSKVFFRSVEVKVAIELESIDAIIADAAVSSPTRTLANPVFIISNPAKDP